MKIQKYLLTIVVLLLLDSSVNAVTQPYWCFNLRDIQQVIPSTGEAITASRVDFDYDLKSKSKEDLNKIVNKCFELQKTRAKKIGSKDPILGVAVYTKGTVSGDLVASNTEYAKKKKYNR